MFLIVSIFLSFSETSAVDDLRKTFEEGISFMNSCKSFLQNYKSSPVVSF